MSSWLSLQGIADKVGEWCASDDEREKFRDAFQRYDMSKTGFLMPAMFARAISSLRHTSLCFLNKLECRHVLNCEYYEDGWINYRRSLHDVGVVSTFGDDTTEHGPSVSRATDGPRSEPEQALRVMKAALQRVRLESEQLFIHVDPMRSGLVTKERFSAAVLIIEGMLGERHIEQLASDFRDRRQPECINYRRLCAALANAVVIGDELPDQHRIVREVYHATEMGKTVYDLFSDNGIGPIPANKFKSQMESCGIIISEDDMRELLRTYRANSNDVINWWVFCEDVVAHRLLIYESR